MQTSDSLTSPSSSYGTQVIIMTCGTRLICYWIKWSICFLPLGDVFIIYCKDRGSQTLPPNQLYNTRLHSIDQHATLVKLKKKNRVFSVYEFLHLQQVELLGDCVKQLWFWYMWFLFCFDQCLNIADVVSAFAVCLNTIYLKYSQQFY